MTESGASATTPMFTIFIPTYNRRHTLQRALDSVAAQTFRDFELVIVDDGSTDETLELVATWKDTVDFSVDYVWQTNRGKHGAHNTGVHRANGELFVILDSDDALLPDVLENVSKLWCEIPATERSRFAGVEGLFLDMKSREILGDRFPSDIFDSTYGYVRHRLGIRGDKANAIRTDILRRFPYPEFETEKHVRPSLVWQRISGPYMFRYVNIPMQLKEYQPDGISSKGAWLRQRNPRGYALYFRESAESFRRDAALRTRLRLMSNHVRYALHGGIGLRQQWSAVSARGLWLSAVPLGWLKRQADRLRGAHRRITPEAWRQVRNARWKDFPEQ